MPRPADNPSKQRWNATVKAVRRAMRRGGPERVAIIAVPADLADELRRGIASERVYLQDRGEDELPVLVVKPPGRRPERLEGWSPTGRKRRG